LINIIILSSFNIARIWRCCKPFDIHLQNETAFGFFILFKLDNHTKISTRKATATATATATAVTAIAITITIRKRNET